MSEVKVSATGIAGVSIDYDFDAAWEGASEEVRKANFRQSVAVTLQANLRRMLKAGKSQEELQAYADAWMPGVVQRTKKSFTDKTVEYFNGLDEAAKKEFLKQLKNAQ